MLDYDGQHGVLGAKGNVCVVLPLKAEVRLHMALPLTADR